MFHCGFVFLIRINMLHQEELYIFSKLTVEDKSWPYRTDWPVGRRGQGATCECDDYLGEKFPSPNPVRGLLPFSQLR